MHNGDVVSVHLSVLTIGLQWGGQTDGLFNRFLINFSMWKVVH
jgi:hypothetical protein